MRQSFVSEYYKRLIAFLAADTFFFGFVMAGFLVGGPFESRRLKKEELELNNKNKGSPQHQNINIHRTHGLVLWYINHCRLFNAKSSLFIYIKYI